jgi:short subunit dehydrogenase-like uncharacterized protein
MDNSDATARTRPRRDVDLVVYGATGFTGSLVAEYLARNAPTGLRIALAGRNEGKLAAVRTRLAGRAHDWPLIVADARDRAALDRLAVGTAAVVSTAGPFAEYGIDLVGACAENGTHYADITGEVLFMRDSIDRYDAAARASRAKIVHSCGFDSIPSDLGVFVLHTAARNDDGAGHLTRTHYVVRSARGGFSGGTIRSGITQMQRAAADDKARAVLADPYSLSPHRAEEPPGDADPWGVRFDDVLGLWVGPFVMAAINTRVVRRSNALSDYAYGREFHYDEGVATGGGITGRLAAAALAGGTALGRAALGFGPTRAVAEKVLPDPGEGPGEKARQNGNFHITLHSRTPQRVLYRATVAAQGDPGYAATSLMLGQAGLTLARDHELLPETAGVLTPATAMGMTLVDNLKAAGMTITAQRV